MNIKRMFAKPDKNTFKIKPIKDLINRYLNKNQKWIDPFCNNSIFNKYCYKINDMNPKIKADFNLEAEEFFKQFNKNEIDGILFDPPYSNRQIKEHYENVGLQANALDTSYNFYGRCYDQVTRILKQKGKIITFGWNSNGVGSGRGFKKIEILLIAHGLGHNDTIVTVEEKIQGYLF